MITIKNDGTIEPFGLKFLRESKLQLIAPTRDIKDTSDEFDGEIDFGAELKCSDWILIGVTEEGLNTTEKMQVRRNIAGHLNTLRLNGGYLKYESDPEKSIFIRMSGRAEIEEYPSWLKVHIPLKVDPFWESTDGRITWPDRQVAVGMGDVNDETFESPATVYNAGNADAPIIMELTGPATNPEIVVGDKILTYFGILTALDKLEINTEHKTVKFNGQNGLMNYEGGFPLVPPGQTLVGYESGGTLILKWHDKWV